jgi:streptomycin 6-kinase
MQRAERDLARTRLAASDSDPAATTILAAAISGLRELSTPYHLAHGLLDYAQHLTRTHNTEAAEAIVGEACHIARNLRCQPLLDRAADMTSEKSPAAD